MSFPGLHSHSQQVHTAEIFISLKAFLQAKNDTSQLKVFWQAKTNTGQLHKQVLWQGHNQVPGQVSKQELIDKHENQLIGKYKVW